MTTNMLKDLVGYYRKKGLKRLPDSVCSIGIEDDEGNKGMCVALPSDYGSILPMAEICHSMPVEEVVDEAGKALGVFCFQALLNSLGGL